MLPDQSLGYEQDEIEWILARVGSGEEIPSDEEVYQILREAVEAVKRKTLPPGRTVRLGDSGGEGWFGWLKRKVLR